MHLNFKINYNPLLVTQQQLSILKKKNSMKYFMLNRFHRLMFKCALLPHVSFQEILQVKIKNLVYCNKFHII